MQKIETPFEGLYIIQHKVFSDPRGTFIKTYNQTLFNELGLPVEIKERYFSVSHKNVLRGMHFQTPPHDHIKLVTVMQGAILDVVLDIRTQANTFGQCFSTVLKADDGKTLFIPKGFAHGFLSLEHNTIVEYNQTTEYAPNNDAGLHYASFDFYWGIDKPIVSDRDLTFSMFANYTSPF
ncbi:MAG: dTDP-4-dehydrorhamnose 3,5-epimerase family protein [Salinivirgaceae bacterium]|jgi:dTDP-4-dehydrorhamnose 3,5-epimerase|nr:dTDP-4-dehydrorhamnose 3,5-epimerase family protein [Salinivirgaceae bacterium]